MVDISRGGISVKGFLSPEMEFQLIRQLGSSTYGGASVGECLGLAQRIGEGNPEDWVNEFERLALWQKEDGMRRLAQDHLISARDQLFKASNSFRAAEYYSPCSSEHHRRLGAQSESCFAMAITTMNLHFESHSIPYKEVMLPAYFISPRNDGVKRKTLMIVSGFDGTMEEEFLMRGLAAIDRGYNVIHFAGPGQMDVFRKYSDSSFEPDFEKVVKKIIDHFEFRQEVDMDHLALMGISIGGYFSVRAASHEPRIKALIANSPVLDVHAYLAAMTGMNPSEMPDEDDFSLDNLYEISDEEFPRLLKNQTEQLLTRYGRHSFKNTFKYLEQFKVGEAIENIHCACFAMIGNEGEEPRRQFEQFCEATGAESYEFSDFEGAGTHCQVGNPSFSNAIAYDWLDKIVSIGL